MSKDKGKAKPGGKGDDFLEGTPRTDILLGKKGSDVIIGKGGDDLLVGGKGTDTALYSGSFLDYKVKTLGPIVFVQDVRAGSPDGTDMLLQIEQVQFADYTLFLDGRNNAPYAVADRAETTEDDAIVISRAQLVANDRDPEGNALSIVDVKLVSGDGSVALVRGNVAYDPGAAYQDLDAGETATVVLEYKVTDGRGAFDTAHVTITIRGADDGPANQAPVAGDDAFAIDEDNVLSGSVLANDSDADLDGLSAILASGPEHGTLVLNADGTFTYTPDENFNGADSFSYRANDGSADSNVATVTIAVAAVNDAPDTSPDSNTASDDGVAATGNVLDNDHDVDANDEVSVAAGTFALAHGTLQLGPQGHYSYRVTDQTLGAGDVASDSFSYSASDGEASSAGEITFHLVGSNDGPVANADALAAPFSGSGPVTRAASDLLGNDTDVDQGTVLALQPGQVTTLLGATVTFDGSQYTYDASGVALLDGVPTGGVVADRFEYTVSDGDGGFATASVELGVHGRMAVANNAPVAGHESFSTNAMYAADGSTAPMSIPLSLLLRNDFDPDGDPLTITGIDHSSGGSFAIVGDSVVFTPIPGTGVGPVATTVAESEPNDDFPIADFIPRIQFGIESDGLAHASYTGEADGPDLVQFNLRAGETYTVHLEAFSGPFIFLGITDQNNQIISFSEGTDLVYTAAVDGTYGAFVDGAGSYEIDLSFNPVLRAEPGFFSYVLSDGRGGESFGSVSLLPVFGNHLRPSTAGGDFANNFLGGALADVLDGGNGNDTLTGGGGADHFVFRSTDGTDTLTDFQRGLAGDMLDLLDFPTTYAPGADIDSFVRFEDFGVNSSRMMVDADGSAGGAFYQPVAILEGHTGLNASQLLADGNLLI